MVGQRNRSAAGMSRLRVAANVQNVPLLWHGAQPCCLLKCTSALPPSFTSHPQDVSVRFGERELAVAVRNTLHLRRTYWRNT